MIGSIKTTYDLGKIIEIPHGYFLLEYTPDDGRGRIAYVDKIPLIGFAFTTIKKKFGLFPLTLRGLYIHDENKRPSILCPCGGVCSGGDDDHDIFLDNIDDFMQASAFRHSMGWKG